MMEKKSMFWFCSRLEVRFEGPTLLGAGPVISTVPVGLAPSPWELPKESDQWRAAVPAWEPHSCCPPTLCRCRFILPSSQTRRAGGHDRNRFLIAQNTTPPSPLAL